MEERNILLQEQIIKRIEYLENVIKQKEKCLANAPEGGLRCLHRGNNAVYYRTGKNDRDGKYIKKENLDSAAELAQKDYDRKVLQLAQKERNCLRAINKCIEKGTIEGIYERQKEARRRLISPVRIPDDEFEVQWRKVEFIKKGFSENYPEYYTNRGERVRSKSEILLADAFERMHIPYRYEFPIILKNIGTVHPDFTLLNTRSRKEYYWEHFGIMDDPEYAKKAVERIEAYEQSGFFPGEKLIISYETSERPLNMKLIHEMIERYFL